MHRGCRGFDYDNELAKRETSLLKNEIASRLGIYAIQCGIETDWESLVLHGADGQVVDVAELAGTSEESVAELLTKLYPDMPGRILRDMVPLVQGNIVHSAAIRASARPLADAEHREWVLGIGRGFDWLHEINTALIVGPFEPDLSTPIETAARLLEGNLNEGRLDGKNIVLLSVAPYRDRVGDEPLLAEAKALFLNSFALQIIRDKVPDLLPCLQVLTATVDMNTRQLTVLQRIGKVE